MLVMPNASSSSVPSSGSSADQQRQLEASVEALLQRLSDLRLSLATLITRMETDPTLNWPAVLDAFALVSGQMNSLLKHVKTSERVPTLKKYLCLPLLLSPERDDTLIKLTEGRVPNFGHDLVPDYLRTKPDPEVEAKHNQYESRANALAPETAQKQITVLEKVVRETLKTINKERDDMETRFERNRINSENELTHNVSDTHALVAALALGRGLKPQQVAPPVVPQQPSGLQTAQGGGSGSGGVKGRGNTGKATSSIKANIKPAAQVHPYAR